MPKKLSIDEVIGTRKEFSNEDGVMFKAFAQPTSWDKKERSAVFVMSSEVVDRHSDVVVQSGIDAKDFDNNPVAFYNHNSFGTPIGSWSDVKLVKGRPHRTEGKMTFAPEGVDDDADKISRHVAAGTIKATSIGFRPTEVERIFDKDDRWTGYKFLAINLHECSIVSIPAVASALVKSAAEGCDLKDIIHPEVIEEFLDTLKSNPAVAKMVDKQMYEDVLAEITGNKTYSAPTASAERPEWLDELKGYTETIKASQAAPIEEVAEDASPEDEAIKSVEAGVETILKDAEAEIEDVPDDKKSGFIAILKSIRDHFSTEPEPIDEERRAAAIERMKRFETE